MKCSESSLSAHPSVTVTWCYMRTTFRENELAKYYKIHKTRELYLYSIRKMRFWFISILMLFFFPGGGDKSWGIGKILKLRKRFGRTWCSAPYSVNCPWINLNNSECVSDLFQRFLTFSEDLVKSYENVLDFCP